MRIALSEMVVEGIKTNIPLHQELMLDATFMRGGTSIHYLEEKLAQAQALSRSLASLLELVLLGSRRRAVEALVATRCSTSRRAVRRSVATPTPAPPHETPMFGEPGVPPPPRLAARRASRRCSPTRPTCHAALGARWSRRRGTRRCPRTRSSRGRRRGLGAPARSRSSSPMRDRARLLDRAELARAARSGAQRDPPRPGLAFGTGTHPTTRLCLRWLARRSVRGGGARARLRLRLRHPRDRGGEARRARASTASTSIRRPCDATRANAQANGVAVELRRARRLRARPRIASSSPTSSPKPLILLAPLLAARARAGGALALSGILRGRPTRCARPTRRGSISQVADERRRLDPHVGTRPARWPHGMIWR